MNLKAIKQLLLYKRPTPPYLKGVEGFLQFAYKEKGPEDKICCPCVKCVNRKRKKRNEVYEDLVCHGIPRGYISTTWGAHGETPEYILANRESQSHANQESQSQSHHDRDNTNMQQLVRDAFGYQDNEVPTNEPNAQNCPSIGPDNEAEDFYNLLRDAEEPLWTGCELSKLSFLVLLFHTKSVNKWSNKSLNDLLAILQLVVPGGKNIPSTFAEAKKIMGKLGLSYQKIHACENNCQLYRKDKANDDFCSKCGTSRWKDKAEKTTLTKNERKKAVPRKVLRYFPMKPRLKRLFMHKETATSLRWHDEERTKDGALRHPADSDAWKDFDSRYPNFATDSRNIRFAVASDGFNPFGMLSSTYSCWPVMLMPYNLPPWLCMKVSSLMLAIIIPGPSYPGKEFHVFMEPVYEELDELFEVGIPTYDASRDEMFQLRATILYTISDFPGLGIFSCYSVNGMFGCFSCREQICSLRLKHGHKFCFLGHRRFLPADHEFRYDANSFDGTEEHRPEPICYSKISVLQEIQAVPDFEKSKTWKGISGLFALSYWDSNLLRHNLDVMHIEKNVCENIYGTLLGLEGKSKDNLQARQDLQEMNIRPDLHPEEISSNKFYLPPAPYTMSKEEKQQFCKVLHDIKVPDGYAGNISRCVKVAQGRISGLKSHDCHILMQQLLPVALRGVVPDNVASVLFDLCAYFRELCGKVLRREELEKLEERIRVTLSRMEIIFTPGFFTVMMHLPIHLATEAKIGGPVCYRSMYFVERYLRVLKSYVRNKADPEGCIAEAYLADECMAFCSRYLQGFETKHNRPSRNDDNDDSPKSSDVEQRATIFPRVGKPLGKPGKYILTAFDKLQAHRYVLFNCSDVNVYLRAHADEITSRIYPHRVSPNFIESEQNKRFHEWFKSHIMHLERENGIESIKEDIRWLARGPIQVAKRYRGFQVRGIRFRPKRLDRVTQNSGIVVTAKTSSYAKAGDSNPTLKNVTSYGRVIDIIELNYVKFSVVLFKCEWVDVVTRKGIKKDKYGYTLVNFSNLIHTGKKIEHEPFILPNQADQVFYVDDLINPGWSLVLNHNRIRDMYDTGSEELTDDIEAEPFHVSHLTNMFNSAKNSHHWARTDVEGITVDATASDNRPNNDP